MGQKNIGFAIEEMISEASREIEKHYQSFEQSAGESKFAIDTVELIIRFDLHRTPDGTTRLLVADDQHSLKFHFSKGLTVKTADCRDSVGTQPVSPDTGATKPNATPVLIDTADEKDTLLVKQVQKASMKMEPAKEQEIALFDDDEPAPTIDLDESELVTGSESEIINRGKIIIKDEEFGDPKGHVLLEKIGQGGMSSVYLAQNIETSELCVIKFLSIVSKDTDTLKRFFQEVRISLRLDHPHIARTLGFDKTAKNVWYLILEYIRGKGLKTTIRESGTVAPKTALKIAFEVASALKHAFQFHIIHRDLKPENILLENSTGNVKLIDFGIGKILGGDSKMTLPNQILGTFHYMAPEQLADTREADQRADIYALGATMYEMLCGRPPYGEVKELVGVALAKCQRDPYPMKSLAPNTPDAIVAIVEKAMCRDIQGRYQYATEMIAAICDAYKYLP